MYAILNIDQEWANLLWEFSLQTLVTCLLDQLEHCTAQAETWPLCHDLEAQKEIDQNVTCKSS